MRRRSLVAPPLLSHTHTHTPLRHCSCRTAPKSPSSIDIRRAVALGILPATMSNGLMPHWHAAVPAASNGCWGAWARCTRPARRPMGMPSPCMHPAMARRQHTAHRPHRHMTRPHPHMGMCKPRRPMANRPHQCGRSGRGGRAGRARRERRKKGRWRQAAGGEQGQQELEQKQMQAQLPWVSQPRGKQHAC